MSTKVTSTRKGSKKDTKSEPATKDAAKTKARLKKEEKARQKQEEKYAKYQDSLDSYVSALELKNYIDYDGSSATYTVTKTKTVKKKGKNGKTVKVSKTTKKTKTLTTNVRNALVMKTNGIEGLPYQFSKTVDRRVQVNGKDTQVGRKYAEKIFARMPLLFLTPAEPLFMDDFSDTDKRTIVNGLLETASGVTTTITNELIEGNGRYYSLDFAYNAYYNYLNCMLSCVAKFMGIDKVKIPMGKGGKTQLGSVHWQDEMNSAFKTFFAASENVIFYLDSFNQVSESFSNETGPSSLASSINGFSDTANELSFLFGKGGNVAANLMNEAGSAVSSITSSLSGVVAKMGGGIVGTLADSGINTVVNGGKIVFPEIWNDSSHDTSFSLELKLRSPDNDNISIFMNIIKPYCKILAMCMPRMMKENPNGYTAPFLCRAYVKGMFSIEYGIISSISVTKGGEGQWNDDGLPTSLDISLEIKDLYKSLSMSAFDNKKILPFQVAKNVVGNTAYMDFLANMAGLNIAQMQIGRQIKMFLYITGKQFSNTVSTFGTRVDNIITRAIGRIYDRI